MNDPKMHNLLGVEVKCLSWNIMCNQHLNCYMSIDEYYEKDELIGVDTSEGADIIQMQIYQSTPVGFILLTANTLLEIQEELKKGI